MRHDVSPQGWLKAAFIIDVFAQGIEGWQVSDSTFTDFVHDALKQALFHVPAGTR
nr:hypothetical protein [Comamonas sp. Tr-654]